MEAKTTVADHHVVVPEDGPAARVFRYFPGIAAALVVALAAKFLEGLGLGPALMIALICGLLLNFMSADVAAKPGVQFAAKHMLAAGVALLGARLTLGDVIALGWTAAITVALAMAAVMVVSWYAAKALRLSVRLGILAGCGTAICGASAAVAAASVFRKDGDLERDTALVVITVVVLSAIAMIVYPILAHGLGLTDLEAGVFLGGSIHNVPQAVGAGYTFSEPAGDLAALTKLYRVSLLAPIVVGISLMVGAGGKPSLRSIGIPWFVVVFALLVILSSVVTLPPAVKDGLTGASNWLLLIAIGAIGMNTSIASIRTVGGRVVLLVLLNSTVLAGLLLGAAFSGVF